MKNNEILCSFNNEILSPALIWMKLMDIMPSKISQSQKVKLYDSTYMKYLSQNHRNKVERWLARAGEVMAELVFRGVKFQFCKMKLF